MKTIYPATIEKIDNQYWLEFPDLDGCQTWGDTIEEVLSNAVEALEGYILSKLENDLTIKSPSDIKDIVVSNEVTKTYIYCDIDIKSTKPIKKTLTIPEWVNKIGIDNNINFSQTLTDAIVQQYKFSH